MLANPSEMQLARKRLYHQRQLEMEAHDTTNDEKLSPDALERKQRRAEEFHANRIRRRYAKHMLEKAQELTQAARALIDLSKGLDTEMRELVGPHCDYSDRYLRDFGGPDARPSSLHSIANIGLQITHNAKRWLYE
jgi:hypothetical protein